MASQIRLIARVPGLYEAGQRPAGSQLGKLLLAGEHLGTQREKRGGHRTRDSAERDGTRGANGARGWVKGRWHDNRHTLVTELAESGAGDEVVMSIAGHVSRAMLSRYSHVRMEAKRCALDENASRQRAADEKGQQEL